MYEAILNRPNATAKTLRESLAGLSGLRQTSSLPTLLKLIEERDANGHADTLGGLSQLLAEQPAADLKKVRAKIENLAAKGTAAETRQLGYVAWIVADGSGDAAFLAASKSKESLRDLLAAAPSISDSKQCAAVCMTPVRSADVRTAAEPPG